MAESAPRRIDAYPTKEKRLEQLDALGLNIADFIHFARGEFVEDKAREFFEKCDECVSGRTFSDDEYGKHMGPVKYEMSEFEQVKAFCMENTGRYHILINQAIAVKDAFITGKILWKDGLHYCIDYFYGAGTPRDIENMGGDLKVAEGTARYGPLSDDASANIELRKVVNKTQDVTEFLRVEQVTLEFQIYPYPVGKRDDNVVFWEWLV
jgi:hypothetical protein